MKDISSPPGIPYLQIPLWPLTDLRTFSSGDEAADQALKARAAQIVDIYGGDPSGLIQVFRAEHKGTPLVVLLFIAGDGRHLPLMLTADGLSVYQPNKD